MNQPMPYLETTPTGWQLKFNDVVVAQSFRADGATTALLDGDAWLALPLQESTPLENGFTLRYGDARWSMTERVRMLPNGLLEVERSWAHQQPTAQNVALIFEVHTQFDPSFSLIPCVSYNGNQWGSGAEPKGLTWEGQPWVFSYKRTGLPAATFSENSEVAVGVWVDDKTPMSLVSACSLEKTAHGMIHRILWPERETPKSYTNKDQYGAAVQNTVRLAPGTPVTVKCYVAVNAVAQANTGWTRAFDRAQEALNNQLDPHIAPEQVWALGVDYAQQTLFQNLGEAGLFHIGLLPATASDNGWQHRTSGPYLIGYEIGWCGQNATFAHALLHNYAVHHNPQALQQATLVLDIWTREARFANGLFAVQFDDILAGKTEIVSDTCNLGWGAWQTLRAYEKARQIGLDKPEWLSFGLGLCDFFVTHSDEQGRFGKLWTQAGTCVDWHGTVGCFILLPLLHAYRMTQKTAYLERAVRGFNYYVTHDLNRIECTAGALDTHCIDKETCWPLLASALDLYEMTNEQAYLNTATLAGYYTLSWMFHYDALYPQDSDFARYGYRTLGATAVSTQHHHLDPWGALLCRDWLRLYQHTGDARWLTRARTTWANSLFCLSDGTLEIHGRIRPRGSQNEGFLHCNWGFNGAHPDGGLLNDWLVAWPGAFRLLTLMDTADWDLLRPTV